jgi:putative flippase GtrA
MKKFIDKAHSILNYPFKKIFKKDLCRITFGQIIKHYTVGAVGVFLNFSIFNTLVLLGLGIVNANTYNGVMVTIITFFLQKHFTYQAKKHSWRQPIGFVATSIGYYFLDTVMLIGLVHHLSFSPALSKLITITCLAPLSFVVQKYVVFR